MLQNLNQPVVAANGLPFITKPRPSANQRAKTLTLVLLGTAGLVLAVGGVAAFLLYSQIDRTQVLVSSLQVQEGDSDQIAKRYQTTLQSYNDAVNKLQTLDATLPPKQYIPTLLQQLQVLAQTTHLTVISVKPGMPSSETAKAVTPAPAAAAGPAAPTPKASAPPYETQPIDIMVSGTYSQVMTFIYSLPTFPKVLALEGVTLSPKSATGSSGANAGPLLTANLLINAYVFDESSTSVPTSTTPTQVLGSFTAARQSADQLTDQIGSPKTPNSYPGSMSGTVATQQAGSDK
jgi:Tfp pilus assembly protein PilO